MKRLSPWILRALVVCLLGGAGSTLGAAPAGAGAPTAPPPTPRLTFQPVTIANFGPISTNQPNIGWLDVGGDWVGFAASQPGCGHCQSAITTLYLQNVLTGKRILIRSAMLTSVYVSHTGASNIRFVAPRLFWTQPAESDPRVGGAGFVPGDFACATCYYDVTTAQGGPWTGGDLPPAPAPPYTATLELPPPPDDYVPQTLVVRQQPGNDEVLRHTFAPEDRIAGVRIAADKLVYAYTQFGAQGSHGSPQLIQLVWLTPPNGAFAQVWAKADQPVAAHQTNRSWLWGPAPQFLAQEAYAEGPGGTHLVQYYDKSRMEVNQPGGDPHAPFYVTNGLLAVELISGQIQVGDRQAISMSVACNIPIAGDPRKDNPLTPDYAALAGVASLQGNNQAADRTGQPVAGALDVNGVVSTDPAHAGLARYSRFVEQTKHNIPDVFWTYLDGMQREYGFDWTFVLGYPITEGYWTQMRVGGKDYPVLVQAYQRRVLTYSPDFAPEWRVQQGNVGMHYLEWRYTLNGLRFGSADGLPTP